MPKTSTKKGPAWLYNQSSVIPFVELDGQLHVVLITSQKSKNWIVPKGAIDKGLSPQESAANEALEEAGVLGTVADVEIGYYEYEKWNGVCRVRVYAMRVSRVLDEWHEMVKRDRRIVPVADAVDMVKNRDLANIIANYDLSLSSENEASQK